MKNTEIREYIKDCIDDYVGTDCEDLHHNMFNTDYYIVGTHEAKEWCGTETFEIIETIKEYEQGNFGEVTTDFSDPEKVVNMYVYIVGEEILGEFWELLQGELTQGIADEISRAL